VEEIGRTRLSTVAELMEEANRFADREDAYNNKRGRSPESEGRGEDVHQICVVYLTRQRRCIEQEGRGENTAAGIIA
jgi:hypothetical protein